MGQKHVSEERFRKIRPPMIENFQRSVPRSKGLNDARPTGMGSPNLHVSRSMSNIKEHQDSLISNGQESNQITKTTKKVSFRHQLNSSSIIETPATGVRAKLEQLKTMMTLKSTLSTDATANAPKSVPAYKLPINALGAERIVVRRQRRL